MKTKIDLSKKAIKNKLYNIAVEVDNKRLVCACKSGLGSIIQILIEKENIESIINKFFKDFLEGKTIIDNILRYKDQKPSCLLECEPFTGVTSGIFRTIYYTNDIESVKPVIQGINTYQGLNGFGNIIFSFGEIANNIRDTTIFKKVADVLSEDPVLETIKAYQTYKWSDLEKVIEAISNTAGYIKDTESIKDVADIIKFYHGTENGIRSALLFRYTTRTKDINTVRKAVKTINAYKDSEDVKYVMFAIGDTAYLTPNGECVKSVAKTLYAYQGLDDVKKVSFNIRKVVYDNEFQWYDGGDVRKSKIRAVKNIARWYLAKRCLAKIKLAKVK